MEHRVSEVGASGRGRGPGGWSLAGRLRECSILATLVAVLLSPRDASAHAFLKESTPAANAVLPVTPASVTMRFTEPLERSYSKAELYDQSGTRITGITSRAGDDKYSMAVDLPPALPNGTYAVLWRTLSAADGHTAQGYFAFTIGSEADVRMVAPPAAATTGGPSDEPRTIARWMALLGLAVTIAVYPVWLLVLRPAFVTVRPLAPGVVRRLRRFAVGGVALALLGSLYALLYQAAGIGADAGLGSGLATTLGQTRYGSLWLLRVGMILMFGAVLLGVGWWWPRRRPVWAAAALLLAVSLPIPFSMLAHAAAQPVGSATAIAADMFHLLGASLWAGGLSVLVVALVPILPRLTPPGRRVVLSIVIPRFSFLALVAWAVMGTTGLYNAWLNVGSLAALRQTEYGRTLSTKLVLLLPLLALGAFNLLIVSRRLKRAADKPATAWSNRFETAIVLELVMVVIVLLVVGRLIGQPPAREVLAQEAGRLAIPFVAEGQAATLYVSPGATGPNHYRLELGSGHAQHVAAPASDVQAVLRFELPSRDTGQKQIVLNRAAGNAFEGHGSELAIAGEWTIEVKVSQVGQSDWRATATRIIGTTPASMNLPGPPWRFGPAGIVALLLLVAGIAGLVAAWRVGRSPVRKETAGLGAAALAFGGLLLLQARIEPASALGGATSLATLPAPDPAAVVRGESLFAANCVTCHGSGGKGDGPDSASLTRPPADLTSAHALTHRDVDLAFWIANGISGTEMPPFGSTLSPEQISDVVAYLRDLQRNALAVRESADAAACLVTPRTIDSIRALSMTAMPRPSPDIVAETGGGLADSATVAGVTATAQELVACINAGDQMRRLALYSDSYVQAAFPTGPTEPLIVMAATPLPIPADQRLALLGISDVRRVSRDRVSALVTIDNPARHTHGPVLGTPGVSQQQERALLLFVLVGDRWLIDDVKR